MNFFSMLNQVQAAEARNAVNAKTESFKAPVVEPADEEETPVQKPKKQTKQKPAEGSGAENIEQKETPAEEIKTDIEEE